MRKIIATLSCLLLLSYCKSQPGTTGEFAKNPSDLIYSLEDINALRFVVDSLNLKFKTCDLNKKYYTYPHAKIYKLTFSSKTNDLQEVMRTIGTAPDLYTMLKKYAAMVTQIDSSVILVKFREENKDEAGYLIGNAEDGFNYSYLHGLKDTKRTGAWTYQYDEKDNYNKAYSINCVYAPEGLKQTSLPDKYAKLIQYVDCMIDTASTVFFKNNKERDFYFFNDNPLYKDLNSFVNKKMNIKKNKENEYEYAYLTKDKIKFIIDSLRTDIYVEKKVNEMADLFIKDGGGDNTIEELIATFISKEKALQIKRSRIVIGGCSMDQSPRIHARNIAQLAAETHNWDIFLRAHLDIMNDRFERSSDGSWAWATRQTYLKELETLDINVIDMMLGLCLRSYNVAENHYNGSVNRIGRALCDSKDRLVFEQRAKEIMKDNELDEFNRSLMFLLYHSYLNYLPDTKESNNKIAGMKKEKGTYPGFIQSAIDEMKLRSSD